MSHLCGLVTTGVALDLMRSDPIARLVPRRYVREANAQLGHSGERKQVLSESALGINAD